MSIQELKKKEKEMKRNYIMECAQKLFLSKDYDEVSMNSIAKEVGVNKATIYYYFKNKEALYFAIVLRGVQILEKKIKKEVEKGKTGREKFLLHGKVDTEFFSKNPDCMRLLYSPQLHKLDVENINNSEEYQELVKILKGLIYTLIGSIQLGVDDGTIRKDVNPIEGAILVSLIFQSMANMSCIYKDILENEGISEQKFGVDVKDFIRHMF